MSPPTSPLRSERPGARNASRTSPSMKAQPPNPALRSETASPVLRIASPENTLIGEALQQPDAPDPDTAVEIDDQSDADSALGSDQPSDTSTLSSSVMNYTYENGRTYHAYRAGQYVMPNDDVEQDRLDMLHHMWRLILKGELFRAPISKNPHRVLDVGTGTGIWAIDVADMFPSAEVIGNDLSPIQPKFVPPNCSFEVDDCESQWLHAKNPGFDFIHLRSMAGSITDWPKLFNEAFEHTSPGGWIEIQEYAIQMHIEEGDQYMPESITFWLSEMDRASTMIKRTMNVVDSLKEHVLDAGYTSVRDDIYKVPFGTWPKDKTLKELGHYQQIGLLESIEVYSLALFTRVLGYQLSELHVLLAKVRAEIKNPSNHLYCWAHFIYGQRPPVS